MGFWLEINLTNFCGISILCNFSVVTCSKEFIYKHKVITILYDETILQIIRILLTFMMSLSTVLRPDGIDAETKIS